MNDKEIKIKQAEIFRLVIELEQIENRHKSIHSDNQAKQYINFLKPIYPRLEWREFPNELIFDSDLLNEIKTFIEGSK